MSMFLLGLLLAHSTPPPPHLHKSDAVAIRAVKAVLNDPDSARFRDIRQTGEDNYCGWVNSKNAFGGYAGDQLFFDVGGFVQVLDETSAIEMASDPTFGSNIKPCITDAPSLRAVIRR